MITATKPRLRTIAPHWVDGYLELMGPTRAYQSILRQAEKYEEQINAVLELHRKVPDPLEPDGYVCGEDGDIWPCSTRKIFE